MADNVSREFQSSPEPVSDQIHPGLHDNEEHTQRRRKRRKKMYEITNEAVDEEDEPAIAQDSYLGLSSTQDLLGEPDFPSSQWPSFETLDPVSSAIQPIHSSPPVISKRDEITPPWPDAQSVIAIGNKSADPTQQVKDATELSLSILEHAQKWNLSSYPVDLLSDTFEAFGRCIFSLKNRLDCVDTVADSIIKMSESQQSDQFFQGEERGTQGMLGWRSWSC